MVQGVFIMKLQILIFKGFLLLTIFRKFVYFNFDIYFVIVFILRAAAVLPEGLG